jgi:hypothetical protein
VFLSWHTSNLDFRTSVFPEREKEREREREREID